MKNINKILLIIITAYSSNIFTLRGRWAAAGVGYAAGRSSGNSYNPDKTADRQVKRHESSIKKHQQEINKINKNKKLSDQEKQTKIKHHESEIQKIENYIRDLL